MLKKCLTVIALLVSVYNYSQVTGNITSTTNEPLPSVNIFIENTYTGTTTNFDGLYTLDLSKKGTYTVVFQYLGYKTVKKTIDITTFPF